MTGPTLFLRHPAIILAWGFASGFHIRRRSILALTDRPGLKPVPASKIPLFHFGLSIGKQSTGKTAPREGTSKEIETGGEILRLANQPAAQIRDAAPVSGLVGSPPSADPRFCTKHLHYRPSLLCLARCVSGHSDILVRLLMIE